MSFLEYLVVIDVCEYLAVFAILIRSANWCSQLEWSIGMRTWAKKQQSYQSCHWHNNSQLVAVHQHSVKSRFYVVNIKNEITAMDFTTPRAFKLRSILWVRKNHSPFCHVYHAAWLSSFVVDFILAYVLVRPRIREN